MKLLKTMQLKDIDQESRTIAGMISTSNVDRDKDIIDPKGLDTSQYKESGVLLLHHDPKQIVGKCIDIVASDFGIFAKFQLLSEGVSDACDQAYKMIQEGVLKSFSIGFNALEYSPLDTGGYLVSKSELIETSLTGTPSNRDSSITQIKSESVMSDQIEELEVPEEVKEAAPAQEKGKVVESPMINPNPHSGQYNLSNLIKSAIQPDFDAGFEKEVSREIKSSQPWRQFRGFAVPDIAFNQKAMQAFNKASGTGTGQNMEPLLGVNYQDQLLTQTGDAIGSQLLFDKIQGVTNLTGLSEKDVQVPVQTAQSSADYIDEDADFFASSDPAFTTKSLTPKLVTSLSTINLSAIFAQHPALGSTDFIGAEMQRAMAQEINRAFLYGDNTSNTEEPDGLLIQSVDSVSNPTASPIAIDTEAYAALIQVAGEVENYLQMETNGAFILHPEFVDALMTTLKFTGSTEAALECARGAICNHALVRGISLPKTAGTPDNAPALYIGDASTIVTGQWFGYDLLVNPYADSVYNKGAVMVRLHTHNDLLTVDTNRIVRFSTEVATTT